MCRLSCLIAPAFAETHRTIKNGVCSQLVLKGGRGSCKSTFAAVEGLLMLLRNPDIHGVVMRKVGNTLRNTVYTQYLWVIAAMGLQGHFKYNTSPMEITCLKTGQKLMFFGADDPGKIKSLKTPFGYIGYLHFEELDQFSGEEEIRSIEQSVLRGGPRAFEIKTFNPPRTKDNWANKYCLRERPGQVIHHSTYETVPEDWLGRRFLEDAEYLKQVNYAAYEHEYLGIPNGAGGMVFDNVAAQEIGEEQIRLFDRVMNGVDWGWYPDPWAFNRCYYDAAQRTLYIFAEAGGNKLGNTETAGIVKDMLRAGEAVVCDSAEPKSIGDYRAAGIRAQGAKKGPGSVEYSHKWLQSLAAIVVDDRRCPRTYEEFAGYEYERDGNGGILSGYPDRNNHHIDAVRYATERIWRRRGR